MGGSKLFCVMWPLCVYLELGPEEMFFLIYGPPNPWQGCWVPTPGTRSCPPPPHPIWPLASEHLAGITVGTLLCGI